MAWSTVRPLPIPNATFAANPAQRPRPVTSRARRADSKSARRIREIVRSLENLPTRAVLRIAVFAQAGFVPVGGIDAGLRLAVGAEISQHEERIASDSGVWRARGQTRRIRPASK